MKNLRIYIGTQPNCFACKETVKTLGKEIDGVPVYEVDLTSNTSRERRQKMGVTATPTVFIVTGKDEDGNGFWEEHEENHVFHQTGIVLDKSNLVGIVKNIKEGKIIKKKL